MMNTSEFLDGESEFNKDANSFREILLRHLERITRLASTEMRGGYHREVLTSPNSYSTIYIPDTRDTYINAVRVLVDILFAYFDEETTQKEAELLAELDQKRKDIIQNSAISEKKDEYMLESYFIHRKLFRHICIFLKRKNYLQLSGVTE